MTTLGSIRIVNDTPYRARQLAMCGVVFPPGAVVAQPDGLCRTKTGTPLGLQGWPSAIQATGMRWPDGSVRHGRLLAVPRPSPNSDELLPIGPAPELPFVFGAWANLAAAINPRLTVVRADGSRIVSPLSLGGRNLHASPAGIVSEVRQRITGTCLWWSIRTMVGSDCDVIPFRVRIHNSDPSRPQVREDWQEIRFDSNLPAQFWLRDKLGLVATRAPGLFGPESTFSWRLSGPDWLADAQGLWLFDGVFPLIDPAVHPGDEAERVEALQAAATWPVTMQHDSLAVHGLWGPLGNAGALVQGKTLAQADQEITTRAQAFRASRTQIARWGDWDYAEAPDTAQTGEHETHGTSLLAPQVLTCNPRSQPELLLASLGEARRPLQRYEGDLSVVLKRHHPDLTYWSGNVHWVSTDKLGKGSAQATEIDKHYWSGPDPEHWMPPAFLAPVALITADWDLLELGRQEMEQLKGHGNVQLGGFATRAQAWCSYAMAWWRILLEDNGDDGAFVMGWQAWLRDYYLHKTPRGEGGWGAGPGPVRPSIVMRDQRYFWGPRLPNGQPDQSQLPPFWIVWQHHFAVWGLLALEWVEPGLMPMIVDLARTADFYGWDATRGHPFGGVVWQDDGQPITDVVYTQDVWDAALQMWVKTQGTVTSDAGTDWIVWAAGALHASIYLEQLIGGDPAWAARLQQIAGWIAAATNTPTLQAKLAHWGGTLPQVAVPVQ